MTQSTTPSAQKNTTLPSKLDEGTVKISGTAITEELSSLKGPSVDRLAN